MSVSQAAARIYAKALFDIGLEGGSLTQTADELHAVRDALGGLDPQLRVFFELPQLRKEDKLQVVNQAFGNQVGRNVLGLLRVLVDRRREALLGAIVDEFDDLVDQQEGRVQATVITAHPLDAELLDSLRAAIERQTNRQVRLQQTVDPSLLGGIRVSIGDLVVDGSLRQALSDMRRVFASSLA